MSSIVEMSNLGPRSGELLEESQDNWTIYFCLLFSLSLSLFLLLNQFL